MKNNSSSTPFPFVIKCYSFLNNCTNFAYGIWMTQIRFFGLIVPQLPYNRYTLNIYHFSR